MLKSTNLKENHYYLLKDGRIMLYVGEYTIYEMNGWKWHSFIPISYRNGIDSCDITEECINSIIIKEVSYLDAVEESL